MQPKKKKRRKKKEKEKMTTVCTDLFGQAVLPCSDLFSVETRVKYAATTCRVTSVREVRMKNAHTRLKTSLVLRCRHTKWHSANIARLFNSPGASGLRGLFKSSGTAEKMRTGQQLEAEAAR